MAAPSGTTMRAVQYDRYGGGEKALKHVEVPIPSPKKGEVLIRMEATSITGGFRAPPRGQSSPGGSRLSPNGGGLAEYAVASASRTVARPAGVSAVDGVCVLIGAVTAFRALQEAGVSLDTAATAPKKKNVLVTVASGAVGHFAVQLARMGGHSVTATCGARNLGLVRSLGADEALDYMTAGGAELRSPSGREYDAVVHCATGFPWSVFGPVLVAGGGTVVDITPRFVSVVTAAFQKMNFSKKRLVPLIVTPKTEEMELVLGMIEQGTLKTVIDSRHPLSSAQEGWAKSLSGHATPPVRSSYKLEPRSKNSAAM